MSTHPSFRRVIEIVTNGSPTKGRARIALEDDYHHFRVELTFANGKITEANGEALRTPYTLCANATNQLSLLQGMELSPDASAVASYTNQQLQCSHMFDEAGLGIAAAARGIQHRRYEAQVPRHVDGETHASLKRDGKTLLQWQIKDGVIISPKLYNNRPIGKGFARWLQQSVDLDTVEAALVLRRCAMISLGRLRNLDLEVHALTSGHCYVQQPERATQALRVIGSTNDFTNNTEQLCLQDQEWLDEIRAGQTSP